MELSELKINSISIENFKNVCQGEVELTYKESPLNIVGIYGQNGSGKAKSYRSDKRNFKVD